MAVAIIVAAGRGERLGAPGPKAFVSVAGRPMLDWCYDALRAAPSIERVVVALPQGTSAPDGAIAAAGGFARSQSVRNALQAAPDDDVILVHDAARPLVTAELAERCIAALVDYEADAVVAAAPVADTVKEAGADDIVVQTLDRSHLWAVQTPQVFRREVLEKALAQPDDVLSRATDDASLVEAMGGVVRIVESSRRNIKVTTTTDLRLAEVLLGEAAERDGAFATADGEPS